MKELDGGCVFHQFGLLGEVTAVNHDINIVELRKALSGKTLSMGVRDDEELGSDGLLHGHGDGSCGLAMLEEEVAIALLKSRVREELE